MNRLILIGNGFDLAHGLKTSYGDFIKWYMHKCFDDAASKDKGYKYEDNLLIITRGNYWHRTDEDRFKYVEDYLSTFSTIQGDITYNTYRNTRSREKNYFDVKFNSDFLKQLLLYSSTRNWVDIEGVFYEQLISILDSNQKVASKESALGDLNHAMQVIISELQEYLSGLNIPDKIETYNNIIYRHIDSNDVQSKPIKFRTPYNRPFETSNPKEILLLNFNYTDTIFNYINKPSIGALTSMFIHGKLNSTSNPIIFGFGDELDSRYAEIETSKARGWFEYIKSFWYLKTNNYRDLVSFIDSDEYQVLVLGHSCGLSDRTMLQMIFQHDNCRSIKLYYHGNKDLNNHRQTLHEVARHFKDKDLMRRRIV